MTETKHGTAIEWTHGTGYKGETWNPVTGCDRVSPGCAHCYALDLAARLKGMGQKRYQKDGDPKTSGPGFGLTLHPDKLDEPLRWKKPRMVFVNSMSDLFHEGIPDEYIVEVFNVMAKADRHIFQVLTKRPERMRDLLAGASTCEHGWLTHNGDNPTSYGGTGLVLNESRGWPIPNVWLGVSIENRKFVHRADLLRETPAAIRFISAEPLLGPLVWDLKATSPMTCECGYVGEFDYCPKCETSYTDNIKRLRAKQLDLTDIDWLIAGGESGPKHRPMNLDWVRDLRDACKGTMPIPLMGGPEDNDLVPDEDGSGTAFFVKQIGGRTPKAGGRELDGRTWDEMPETAKVSA